MIPELIELTPSDFVTIMNIKNEFCTLGLEVEEFGKSTVAIRTHPQILKNLDFHGLIQSALEEIESDEIKGETDGILRKIAKNNGLQRCCKGRSAVVSTRDSVVTGPKERGNCY